MNTSQKPENILQQMIDILDNLISCQRKEQELVLQRKPNELPPLCGQINSLTIDFERRQEMLLSIYPRHSIPANLAPYQKKCGEKLELLQELAQQNDLLIENSMVFTQELLRQVLGIQPPPLLYDETGIAPSETANTGLLLNQKA